MAKIYYAYCAVFQGVPRDSSYMQSVSTLNEEFMYLLPQLLIAELAGLGKNMSAVQKKNCKKDELMP